MTPLTGPLMFEGVEDMLGGVSVVSLLMKHLAYSSGSTSQMA
jgi:hypothetical protein